MPDIKSKPSEITATAVTSLTYAPQELVFSGSVPWGYEGKMRDVKVEVSSARVVSRYTEPNGWTVRVWVEGITVRKDGSYGATDVKVDKYTLGKDSEGTKALELFEEELRQKYGKTSNITLTETP